MRLLKKTILGVAIIAALALSFVAGQKSVNTAAPNDEISVASIIRGA
ncbi:MULTISPECIES: lysogeny pheromone AimP family peptide [Bacillus]|nr:MULTISPECIES: lysogeny pheromone AimP family peptide [Bacillus]MEC1018622.1 lysogeny pheromone AimP family peptide [Bacillus velezensis]